MSMGAKRTTQMGAVYWRKMAFAAVVSFVAATKSTSSSAKMTIEERRQEQGGEETAPEDDVEGARIDLLDQQAADAPEAGGREEHKPGRERRWLAPSGEEGGHGMKYEVRS
jgi:hypothetical protein